jgi:hypothetical protein
MYHAVTLWAIDELAIWITDSDDRIDHVMYYFYEYDPEIGFWLVQDYAETGDELCFVNYAVAAAGGGPSVTKNMRWSAIKALYR